MSSARFDPRPKIAAAVLSLMLTAALACATGASAAPTVFERAWGKDVVTTGPGNTGTGFEVCVAANGDTCKPGVAGGLGGEMSAPAGLATDAVGNVYVADQVNDRIEKFDSSGNLLRAWGNDVVNTGPGNLGGFEICVPANGDICKAGATSSPALGGDMDSPLGVATDSAGNVYTANFNHHRVQKFDSSGNFLRAWGKDVASAGPGDTGTGFEICVAVNGDTCKTGVAGGLGGEMNLPRDVATDAAGHVFLTDLNNRVQRFNLNGAFQRAWGNDVVSAGAGNVGGAGSFEKCVAADGDTCKAGVSGFLAGFMSFPLGIATDPFGGVYVADFANNRADKFDSNGNFLRAWGKNVVIAGPGNTGTGFEICVPLNGDTCKNGEPNVPAPGGEMSSPADIHADAAGNVYVANRNYYRVDMFDSAGNFLRNWGKDVVSAGPGNTGTGFEVCEAANGDTCKAGDFASTLGGEMRDPSGVVTDSAGNLYVADQGRERIQKFTNPALPSPGPFDPVPSGPSQPPSNAFKIVGVKGKTLILDLSSAGKVTVNDAGAKKTRANASAAAKRKLLLKTSTASGGPGRLRVKLKLAANAVKKLSKNGKVKLRARITFTPTGGVAKTKTVPLKIKRKRKR